MSRQFCLVLLILLIAACGVSAAWDSNDYRSASEMGAQQLHDASNFMGSFESGMANFARASQAAVNAREQDDHDDGSWSAFAPPAPTRRPSVNEEDSYHPIRQPRPANTHAAVPARRRARAPQTYEDGSVQCEWVGPSNGGEWLDADNWLGRVVPHLGDHVIINSGGDGKSSSQVDSSHCDTSDNTRRGTDSFDDDLAAWGFDGLPSYSSSSATDQGQCVPRLSAVRSITTFLLPLGTTLQLRSLVLELDGDVSFAVSHQSHPGNIDQMFTQAHHLPTLTIDRLEIDYVAGSTGARLPSLVLDGVRFNVTGSADITLPASQSNEAVLQPISNSYHSSARSPLPITSALLQMSGLTESTSTSAATAGTIFLEHNSEFILQPRSRAIVHSHDPSSAAIRRPSHSFSDNSDSSHYSVRGDAQSMYEDYGIGSPEPDYSSFMSPKLQREKIWESTLKKLAEADGFSNEHEFPYSSGGASGGSNPSSGGNNVNEAESWSTTLPVLAVRSGDGTGIFVNLGELELQSHVVFAVTFFQPDPQELRLERSHHRKQRGGDNNQAATAGPSVQVASNIAALFCFQADLSGGAVRLAQGTNSQRDSQHQHKRGSRRHHSRPTSSKSESAAKLIFVGSGPFIFAKINTVSSRETSSAPLSSSHLGQVLCDGSSTVCRITSRSTAAIVHASLQLLGGATLQVSTAGDHEAAVEQLSVATTGASRATAISAFQAVSQRPRQHQSSSLRPTLAVNNLFVQFFSAEQSSSDSTAMIEEAAGRRSPIALQTAFVNYLTSTASANTLLIRHVLLQVRQRLQIAPLGRSGPSYLVLNNGGQLHLLESSASRVGSPSDDEGSFGESDVTPSLRVVADSNQASAFVVDGSLDILVSTEFPNGAASRGSGRIRKRGAAAMPSDEDWTSDMCGFLNVPSVKKCQQVWESSLKRWASKLASGHVRIAATTTTNDEDDSHGSEFRRNPTPSARRNSPPLLQGANRAPPLGARLKGAFNFGMGIDTGRGFKSRTPASLSYNDYDDHPAPTGRPSMDSWQKRYGSTHGRDEYDRPAARRNDGFKNDRGDDSRRQPRRRTTSSNNFGRGSDEDEEDLVPSYDDRSSSSSSSDSSVESIWSFLSFVIAYIALLVWLVRQETNWTIPGPLSTNKFLLHFSCVVFLLTLHVPWPSGTWWSFMSNMQNWIDLREHVTFAHDWLLQHTSSKQQAYLPSVDAYLVSLGWFHLVLYLAGPVQEAIDKAIAAVIQDKYRPKEIIARLLSALGPIGDLIKTLFENLLHISYYYFRVSAPLICASLLSGPKPLLFRIHSVPSLAALVEVLVLLALAWIVKLVHDGFKVQKDSVLAALEPAVPVVLLTVWYAVTFLLFNHIRIALVVLSLLQLGVLGFIQQQNKDPNAQWTTSWQLLYIIVLMFASAQVGEFAADTTHGSSGNSDYDDMDSFRSSQSFFSWSNFLNLLSISLSLATHLVIVLLFQEEGKDVNTAATAKSSVASAATVAASAPASSVAAAHSGVAPPAALSVGPHPPSEPVGPVAAPPHIVPLAAAGPVANDAHADVNEPAANHAEEPPAVHDNPANAEMEDEAKQLHEQQQQQQA